MRRQTTVTAGRAATAVPGQNVPARGRSLQAGRQNVLLIVACLLAGSGMLRIGDGAGRAWASTTETSEPAAPDAAATGGPAVAPGPAAPMACHPEAGTADLLAAIKGRAESLDAREARIADRESALALAQSEIAEKMAALEAAEAELSRTVEIADAAAETDVARLVTVYESMKPKDASALFAEMSPEFAAGFLGRMRADAAAPILAGLDPKTAYTISVMLAGRNAAAPKD
jgi:flagellar motility protein MotE (MotC chaperone)